MKKIVYAVRNPKDVIVSFYFFHKSIPDDKFVGAMEDMFNSFVEGKIAYGAWWDHVNQYAALNNKNIHFIHYEDLLEVKKKVYFYKLF